MSRAAIYCRVSTEDQATEGTSLPDQQEKCLAKAKELGYDIPPDNILQESFTGSTLDRPKLGILREWARSGEIDAVICNKYDRLSRDPVDFIVLQDELEKRHVKLILVQEVLDDTDDPFAGPGLIFSTEAIKNKSSSIDSFVKAWQRSVDMINENPDKYQSLLNEVASVPEAVDFTIPEFPRLSLSIETQYNSIVDWFVDKELLSAPLDYQEVVEIKYLK